MTRFAHVAVWVSQWERTRSFYVDGLGLTVELTATIDGVDNYLLAGDGGPGLQCKHDPGADRPVAPSGVDHLAVEVSDLDTTFERLVDAFGAPVRAEPATQPESGNRVAFVEDPDGYVVELVAAGGTSTGHDGDRGAGRPDSDRGRSTRRRREGGRPDSDRGRSTRRRGGGGSTRRRRGGGPTRRRREGC